MEDLIFRKFPQDSPIIIFLKSNRYEWILFNMERFDIIIRVSISYKLISFHILCHFNYPIWDVRDNSRHLQPNGIILWNASVLSYSNVSFSKHISCFNICIFIADDISLYATSWCNPLIKYLIFIVIPILFTKMTWMKISFNFLHCLDVAIYDSQDRGLLLLLQKYQMTSSFISFSNFLIFDVHSRILTKMLSLISVVYFECIVQNCRSLPIYFFT